MFDFMKKKTAPAPAATPAPQPHQATAPGTEIHYHPELIQQLTADHEKLITIYTEINAAFEAGDYPLVSEKLDEFRSGLQGHLLTENVRLYIYLERCLARDETNAELIHSFRREMDGIGRAVMNFLKKYDAIGVDRDLAAAFERDFATIGKVLVERIRKEESVLYPLYMPSY